MWVWPSLVWQNKHTLVDFDCGLVYIHSYHQLWRIHCWCVAVQLNVCVWAYKTSSRTMADITECAVYLEEYQEPKHLPCTHTFCLKCLKSLQKKKFITCPLCTKKHKVPPRGVQAFPENQHAVQLVQDRQVRNSFLYKCTMCPHSARCMNSRLFASLNSNLDFIQLIPSNGAGFFYTEKIWTSFWKFVVRVSKQASWVPLQAFRLIFTNSPAQHARKYVIRKNDTTTLWTVALWVW